MDQFIQTVNSWKQSYDVDDFAIGVLLGVSHITLRRGVTGVRPPNEQTAKIANLLTIIESSAPSAFRTLVSNAVTEGRSLAQAHRDKVTLANQRYEMKRGRRSVKNAPVQEEPLLPSWMK